jgi:hypothetical protein
LSIFIFTSGHWYDDKITYVHKKEKMDQVMDIYYL